MISRRMVFVAVVMLALALLCAVPVLADNGSPPVAPSVPALTEVLTMLASGIGVGAVVAFLFEKFKWFQNLTPNGRFWVVFGISVGLPVVATVLLQFVPAPAWAMIEPYWKAVATGFLIWAGSQLVHKLQV